VTIRQKTFGVGVEKIDRLLQAFGDLASVRIFASVFALHQQKLVPMPFHKIAESPTYHRRGLDPWEVETAISRDPLFQNARNHFLFGDS
jgi:hypothetical protein